MMKKLDRLYMDLIERISLESHCVRAKVAALIVKDDTNIVSFGYNGMPPNMNNVCEEYDDVGNLVTRREVIHGEMNAILKASSRGESLVGTVMYCKLSPCFECSKAILRSGISKVIYKEEFKRDEGAIAFLSQHIPVIKYKDA